MIGGKFWRKIAIINILFLLVASFSQEVNANFYLERISTDFNGVAYNGRNILAYGKYGIITYSTDKGETWKQICLGDKLEILKIITIDTIFYALTPYSILKSTDNGLNWIQRPFYEEPTFRDFTTDGKLFYIINESAIMRIDVPLQGNLETFYQFEFSSLNEIAYTQNHLFCINNRYFLHKINCYSLDVETIDLHNSVLKDYKEVRELSHIKVVDSKVYILVENIHQKDPLYTQPGSIDFNIRHCLLKSSDLGKTWIIVTKNIRLTKEYQVLKDTVFFMTQKDIQDETDKSFYYSIRYFKIDTIGKELEINPNEILERRIDVYTGEYSDVSVANTFGINMFMKIDESIIIGVGPNKTILLSTNNGQNWRLVSYFKPIVKTKHEIKFISKDSILVLVDVKPYYFLSFDGGATFLPPKRFLQNFPSGGDLFIWDDGNFGFAKREIFSRTVKIDNYKYKTVYDSTLFVIKYTKDIGNSFSSVTFKRDFIFYNDTFSFNIVHLKPYNDKFFIVFGGELSSIVDTIPDSYIYFFDNSFNIIDSFLLKKISLKIFSNKYLIVDTVIYLISNPNLMRGKDLGREWEILYSKLNDYNNFQLKYKTYLIISKSIPINQNQYLFRLLIFNLTNNKMDSVEINPLPLQYFIYNDTIYGFKYRNPILYKFTYGIEKMSLYDSIDISPLLGYDGSFVVNITGYQNIAYFHLLKETGSGLFSTYFELNFAKMVHSSPSILAIEGKEIYHQNYTNKYSPYPIPADKYFVVCIDNDLNYTSVAKLSAQIYDSFGNKIIEPNFDLLTNYNSCNSLKIDCSSLSNGSYFLVVNLPPKRFFIPFLVIR